METAAQRVAFFDLDGCLIDSSPTIIRCINHVLSNLNLPNPPELELYELIGLPLFDIFQVILPKLGADAELAQQCVYEYRALYQNVLLDGTKAVTGIPEILNMLDSVMSLIVVTSKPVEFAEPVLSGLNLRHHFQAVLGPAIDDLTERKTATLQRAMYSAGITVHEEHRRVAMVGDRHYDIEAGNYFGLTTIGVTWGSGTLEELRDAGAHHVVQSPKELVPVLLDL